MISDRELASLVDYALNSGQINSRAALESVLRRAHEMGERQAKAALHTRFVDSMLDRKLTIESIFDANMSRVGKWHSLESWSPLEWAGAMCGEAGEAANSAKKLKRVNDQIANNDNRLFGQKMTLVEQRILYSKQIAKEYADVVIYGVLLCARVGMTGADVARAIRDVFNAKSEEYGFPEHL